MDLKSIENLTKMDFQTYIDCFDSFPKNLYFEHSKNLLLKENHILNQDIKNIKYISKNGFYTKPSDYNEKLLKLYIEMLEELIKINIFDCYEILYDNFNNKLQFCEQPQKLKESSNLELRKIRRDIKKKLKEEHLHNRYYLIWYLKVIDFLLEVFII